MATIPWAAPRTMPAIIPRADESPPAITFSTMADLEIVGIAGDQVNRSGQAGLHAAHLTEFGDGFPGVAIAALQSHGDQRCNGTVGKMGVQGGLHGCQGSLSVEYGKDGAGKKIGT